MSRDRKPVPPIRDGKPDSCMQCHGALHRKSEYYCSLQCEGVYKATHGDDAPPFLSKWKLRKNKALRDPLIAVRQKTRRKTKALMIEGKLRRKPCAVCGKQDVIAHHEDYDRPGDVIWLCDPHHKAYHTGQIGLFENKLWWNPNRLIPKHLQVAGQSEKYRILKKNFNRKQERIEQGEQPL